MIGGLSSEDINLIITTLSQFPQVEEVWLFGSRAKGNYKRGSDIDLVIKGSSLDAITTEVGGYLNEESPSPYYYDILNYDSIDNLELKAHVDRVGIPLWIRSNDCF